MSNEERPRITITAERHDELLAAEARLKELHGAGLRALELVGRTMIKLARARQAGRRLTEIHKRKHAELEAGWGVGAGALREALDIAVDDRDAARQENEEFRVSLQEATELLTEGVEVVSKLERERDEALDLLTKGAELVVKLEAERDAAVEEVKQFLPSGHVANALKFHLDFNGSSSWEPNASTTWTQTTGAHAVCDGAIKPDFYVKRDGRIEDLKGMFSGGGTVTAWIPSWEKCYEARELAAKWRDTWVYMTGNETKKLPWEGALVSESRRDKDRDWYMHEARDLAEHWRSKCGKFGRKGVKFPWEEEELDATASE